MSSNLFAQNLISLSDAIRKAIQELVLQKSKKRGEFSNKQILGTITYIEKFHIHAHPPNQKHSHEKMKII